MIQEVIDRGLTPRELEVLEGIVSGLSNEQIADKLCLARATVKTYAKSIKVKFDGRNRVQLAVYVTSQKYENQRRD